jgi:NADH-quinone oxidoreductase subunit C
MALAYAQVYEKLKEKFPQGVVSVVEGAGDPFCVLGRDALVPACRWLKTDPEMQFDLLTCVSGVDDTKTFWVVYHLTSVPRNHRAVLKVDAGREDPWAPTVSEVWKTADWHERETYDMYGIRFEGHPDLRRILLPEDWPGWPLRKDYEFPDEYQGIPLK